ncbi:MAG: hypothetical protein ACD_2C00038G0012 [uncultured bacterium (gcode 4)]|uniref:Uncharacterized protein n=1 Tax=uncultured bacterium (gcode 4) TaxID=1234023 RepID=K2H2U4_9BACT|nr:MAG: hypothetical protein ACD_2C00038G0012 [uncultured bacterium (gcode 4)]
METTSQDNMAIPSGKNTYFIISIVLLIIVIAISAILWFINSSTQKQISESNLKISEYSKQVEELKSNNEIAAYDIIFANKQDILKSIEKSKAQIYLTEVMSLSKKYKMVFSWFTFDWNAVNTNAVYNNKDAKDDAIAWVSSFIKDFRTWTESIFSLSPIASVAWDSLKRSFGITFELKK